MKKLALALMCLVSVAFFASCDPEVTNPEPSIIILQEDGYVQNNDVVDLNTEVKFGFVVSSNATTQKALQKLVVSIDGTEWANLTDTLTGQTTFTYKDVVVYEPQQRDSIVGASVITAIVTDVDGKTATTTINLQINQPAIPLEVRDFEWTKVGHNVMDLTSYGLKWHENNWKSPFTHIYPADGYKLYVRDGNDFANITNSVELASYYSAILEQGNPSDEQYNRIDCNASDDYNDMLVTVNEATEEIQLIHVTRAEITTPSQGTKIVITGQCK